MISLTISVCKSSCQAKNVAPDMAFSCLEILSDFLHYFLAVRRLFSILFRLSPGITSNRRAGLGSAHRQREHRSCLLFGVYGSLRLLSRGLRFHHAGFLFAFKLIVDSVFGVGLEFRGSSFGQVGISSCCSTQADFFRTFGRN